ncbi:NACHT domain-containing protein [Streptomyces sp. NPDC014676]|uniref:NACHT domain-containing protein n=1 Tax=Streptomyces sp. NPDC014676 TaxID=3364879 RepID=UPI0036F6053F
MTNEIFTAQVPRLCRVRADSSLDGDLFPLDGDGFLSDEHMVAPPGTEATPGVLTTPNDVAREGAVVLLGEPGAGKSTVLRSLVQGLPMWDDPALVVGADHCVWVDGPDLTAATWDTVLGRHLARLPSVTRDQHPSSSTGQVTVVIDQADESEICSNLPSYFKRCLRNKDVGKLRLLFACRTGDYPPDLTRVLRDTFRRCSLVDLAPLSRSDAVTLVDSADVHGERLISEVVALHAGALASVPLTLELIVREYRDTGSLRGGAKELFEDGVRLLSQEYDPYRLPTPVHTTWQQRLEVAGRIAARLVLSGRRTLWRGSPREGRPSATDLDVGTLAGGTEQTSGCQPFEVNPTVIDEVLSTGLFTASGHRRFAFRHSSLAAFLAARHLISRSVPDAALRRLLLVGAPDQETAGIPVSLRETAAWLVALVPDRTRWLASADPESLTVHSALVDADGVRELIVRRLLERAADVELGEARWQRTRWVLGHPGLARQLTPVLTLGPGDFEDWETRARVEVALRLAEQCPSPELAPLLLKVAADARWPAGNRAHAAKAAFACDETLAAPALNEVLTTLGPGTGTDSGSRLKGVLLTLLWPRHLDTSTMLDALIEPPSSDRYGMYEHFLAALPNGCPEAEVHRLVTWLAQVVKDHPAGSRSRRKGFAEDKFVSDTIDRALSVPDAGSLLPCLAQIITARMLSHEKVEFPHALNPVIPDGPEPAGVRKLRRELAHALLVHGLNEGQDMNHFVWSVVREWEPRRRGFGEEHDPHGDRHMLLDAGDFPWALRSAAGSAGNPELADAYARLAEVLFYPPSREHFELAYRNQDNPAWPYLRWFYEPIEIDSELAKAWRRNHRAASPKPWPGKATFIAEQRERLDRARQHDTDGFWLLLWHMQCDPNTGQGQRRFDDEISDWPGYSVFTAEELAHLPDCALEFLRCENDHADEWLGLGKQDKRAWAGVLALALLDRESRLDELDADRWSVWAGAIVDAWCLTPPTWELLLERAIVNDPQELARAAETVARAQLNRGEQPLVLERLEAKWSSVVTEVWENFLVALSTALIPGFRSTPVRGAWSVPAEVSEKESGRAVLVHAWASILTRLLAVDNALARSVSESALLTVESGDDDTDLELPALAALLLLEADGFEAWSRLKRLIDVSDRFSRALALKCAGRSERGHVEICADEGELSTLYRWLSTVFPQDTSSRPLGVYTMTPEREALDWRESLPATLSRRGTPEAVGQLKALAADFPVRLNLRAALVGARAQCLASTWTPASLDEVVGILAGVAVTLDPALVKAELELTEALEALQDMDSHAFREGILRDMRLRMNSVGLLPIADLNVARDHLREIARYVYGEGGPAAQRALLAALEDARPDERALERVRGLLAPPIGTSASWRVPASCRTASGYRAAGPLLLLRGGPPEGDARECARPAPRD